MLDGRDLSVFNGVALWIIKAKCFTALKAPHSPCGSFGEQPREEGGLPIPFNHRKTALGEVSQNGGEALAAAVPEFVLYSSALCSF